MAQDERDVAGTVRNAVWDEANQKWVKEDASFDASAAFMRALKDPEFVDRINMAIKVVFPSAQAITVSSGTVTTVTTVTGITNIGAVDAREFIPWQNWQMWNETIRSRIT